MKGWIKIMERKCKSNCFGSFKGVTVGEKYLVLGEVNEVLFRTPEEVKTEARVRILNDLGNEQTYPSYLFT
jgi:hypothetical protein